MDASEFRIYISGFFDGEGGITIARTRANGLSDYHCVHVTLTQRAKHRDILDRAAADYGGHVLIRKQQSRVRALWAETAVWQLQHKAKIRRFLLDIQPFCIVKAKQVAIALEFLATFEKGVVTRDVLGRIHGRVLSADEIERRERLRLALREANELGPPKVKPSALPPLDVQARRQRESELIGDMASVPRGEGHYRTTLTEDTVRAIRLDHARGLLARGALAARYGLTLYALDRIIYRQTWKHVTDAPFEGPVSVVEQPALFSQEAEG